MDGILEQAFERTGGRPAGNEALPTGFAALLPTRTLPRFAPGALVAALNRILGEAAEVAVIPGLTRFEKGPGEVRVWQRSQEPPRLGLTVAGVTLVVEGHDRPAFGARQAEALDVGTWRVGLREIARSRAHVRVFEAAPALGADLDLNHDRAAAVFAVAAAAAELVAPAAVVWEASGVAVAADELAAALPALKAGEAPVALWVGAGPEPRGGVATRGLYPLLGAEIEVRAPALGLAAARKLALGVAAEILETGCPPEEGARIGHGSRGGFRVRYRGAEDDGAPAVVLEEDDGRSLGRAAGAA